MPTLAIVFPVIPDIASTENQAMKVFPEFNKDSINNWPNEFDTYYSDNFTLRNQLLELNSKIRYHWFNIPPYSGKAFIGRQGWMYAIKDEMDHYLGKNIFDRNTLKRFVEIINYRKHILDSINCKYYIVIIPIKATVYPEFLPLSKRNPGQPTLTDQLMDALSISSNIKVIDLSDDLMKQKSNQRLFHKTDNHWNEYGGYVAYRAIMESIAIDFPDMQPLDISNFDIKSIETDAKRLADMMGIMSGVTENEITCRHILRKKAKRGEESNYQAPNLFPYKKAYEEVYVTNRENGLKLLAIRDSFGSTLIPFLNEHFSKSVFIFDAWQHNLNEDILFHEKPDIYIHFIVESLLPNIPRNAKKP